MAEARLGRVRVALLAAAAVATVTMLVIAAVVALHDDPVATPPPTTVPVGGTLRLAVVGPELPVDPSVASVTDQGAAMLDDLLWSRLTATDPVTAATEPALASSWEADPGLTTFTFHLRDDASFSDGSPVRSSDVAASLRRLAALGAASLAGSRLAPVAGYADAATGGLAGVTTPDDATVVIALTEPMADLPSLLSAPAFGVVPAAVADGTRAASEGPTSGPYAMAEAPGDQMVLVRAAGTPTELAHPDRIEVRRFETAEDAAAAFDAGELDVVPLPADRAAEMVRPGRGIVRIEPASAVWWVAIDTTDPVTSTAELRLGYAHAADRGSLVATALPGRRLLDGLYPPQVPGGALDACGDRCRRDPAAASASVSATFPAGAPSITFDTPDSAGPAAVAVGFDSALTAAGQPTEVRLRTPAEYRDDVLRPDRQLFWFGWVGVAPTPEAYLPALFLTGSPDNVTGLSDPSVDRAIAAARAEADADRRAALWAEAEQVILSVMPVVPLAQAQNAVALSDAVQGFSARLDGTFAIDQVWLAPESTPDPSEEQ